MDRHIRAISAADWGRLGIALMAFAVVVIQPQFPALLVLMCAFALTTGTITEAIDRRRGRKILGSPPRGQPPREAQIEHHASEHTTIENVETPHDDDAPRRRRDEGGDRPDDRIMQVLLTQSAPLLKPGVPDPRAVTKVEVEGKLDKAKGRARAAIDEQSSPKDLLHKPKDTRH